MIPRLTGFSSDVRLWSRCSAVRGSSSWKYLNPVYFIITLFEKCHDHLPCSVSTACKNKYIWREGRPLGERERGGEGERGRGKKFFFFFQRTQME